MGRNRYIRVWERSHKSKYVGLEGEYAQEIFGEGEGG